MSQLTTCFVLVTRLLSFFNLLSWSWEKYFMGKCSAEWLHIGIWWREEVTEADEATTVKVLKWNRFAPDQSTALPTWPTGVNLPSLPTPNLTTYPLTSRDQHHPPVSPLVTKINKWDLITNKMQKMQKSKMVVWGGLTNSCEKKRSEKQRRNLCSCNFPGKYTGVGSHFLLHIH